MPREYPRKLRIATELQRVLNDLLRFEVKDPRLVGVSVSAVEVSGDLGHARVFFSNIDPEAEAKPVEAAFASALGFIRHRVGAAMELRRVPTLDFKIDDSIQRGMQLTQLIESVAPGDATDADSSVDDD
jgi:ribosome-binding factor A